MTDLARRANANAISLEVKKDGLQQRQSGDWMLRFVAAGIDMDQRLLKAPMGTRFACVLVEINDDESPVDHKAQERDKWRELGPVKQAGIRCKEPAFWSFLKEELHFPNIWNEERAAACVREHCGVVSRSEFGKVTNTAQRLAWYDLDNAYQAWKVREHA
jgi:hypothetical protein